MCTSRSSSRETRRLVGDVLAFPRKPDDPIELINAELDWYLAMLRQGYHPDEAIRVLARTGRDFDQRFWWCAWVARLIAATRL